MFDFHGERQSLSGDWLHSKILIVQMEVIYLDSGFFGPLIVSVTLSIALLLRENWRKVNIFTRTDRLQPGFVSYQTLLSRFGLQFGVKNVLQISQNSKTFGNFTNLLSVDILALSHLSYLPIAIDLFQMINGVIKKFFTSKIKIL